MQDISQSSYFFPTGLAIRVLFKFDGTKKKNAAKYEDKSFGASDPRLGINLPNHIKLATSEEILARFLKLIYIYIH